MEKVLLKRKTVLEGGVIINKWYCTKNILNHPNNKALKADLGWNITGSGDCAPPCPANTTEGHYDCIGGQCVFIPWG